MKALTEEPVTEGRDAVYIGRDANGIPVEDPGPTRDEYAAMWRRLGISEEKIAHDLSLLFENR
jgi:hypothetical protein